MFSMFTVAQGFLREVILEWVLSCLPFRLAASWIWRKELNGADLNF